MKRIKGVFVTFMVVIMVMALPWVVYAERGGGGKPPKVIDADTLQGHPAADFAPASHSHPGSTDADTLDGMDSTDFADLNHTHSEITGNAIDIANNAAMIPVIQATIPPIGTVVAWMKNLPGISSTLPSNWVECNGQTLDYPESPLDGIAIPNLNVSGVFLKGSSVSGNSQGNSSHNHNWANNDGSGGNLFIGLTGNNEGGETGYDGQGTSFSNATFPALSGDYFTDTQNNEPPSVTVVWIMRVE